MVENYTTDCWNKLRLEVVQRNAGDVGHIQVVGVAVADHIPAVVVAVAGHLEKHGNVVLVVRENGAVEDLETEPDVQVTMKKRAAVVGMDLVEGGDDDE